MIGPKVSIIHRLHCVYLCSLTVCMNNLVVHVCVGVKIDTTEAEAAASANSAAG